MRFSLGIPFIALFFSVSVKAETCLSVAGVQFEKIGPHALLAVKDGKNWGTVEFYSFVIPDGKLEFRFFTPTICDGSQNDKLQINGKLESVFKIKQFK